MKQETAEQLAKTAAIEAVKEYDKFIKKTNKVRTFQNTKKLMENYNRICQSVQEGISDLADIDNAEELEGLTEEDIFIKSILKSKLRSIVMIAHIDKCLKLLEEEECRNNTHEKYLAFKYFYLDGMKQENIPQILNCTDRTIRRWITELTNIMGIYLFGSDAIMLD